jgi:hypothetical protein
LEKHLARATRTTRKTMEVKYFKVKHKVLKNSLHGQLWSDFGKISLCQAQLEKFNASYPGKTKITIINFLINFACVSACVSRIAPLINL